VFQTNTRPIISHYPAKRLALSRSQIVRRFEQQFGELELNVGRRRIERNVGV
jgi:hypothetical protein